MKCMIAVDAGGTKTKLRAYQEDKTVMNELIGGCGSPAVGGIGVLDEIFKMITSLKATLPADADVDFVIIGMSGLGVIADKATRTRELAKAIGAEVILENDAVEGVWSVIKDESSEGVLCLAGTGSACLGIRTDLEIPQTLLMGGWGDRIEEGGSAYGCVHRAILRTIRQYEETLSQTTFQSAFLKSLGCASADGLKTYVYSRTKKEIASAAPFISEQAAKGDREARAILTECGKYLADEVNKLCKHLSLSSNAILGFRGSFVEKAPVVREACVKALRYPITIEKEPVDPIEGCYYQAKSMGFGA